MKKYDIGLIGVTGYVGRLVADYLASSKELYAFTWATAARNKEKYQLLFGEQGVRIGSPDFFELDIDKADDLTNFVSSCKLVLTTAGPFDVLGEKIVRACIEGKTHYLDITGEFQYVRRLIERYHQKAIQARVAIVPFCGFDSIPADLGALLLVDRLSNKYNESCAEIKAYYRLKGGLNGGTLASALRMGRDIGQEDMYDELFLTSSKKKRVNREIFLPEKFEKGGWCSPFFMQVVNQKVVQRTCALIDRKRFLYAEDFRYQERMLFRSRKGLLLAGFATAAHHFAEKSLQRKWGRNLLAKLGPKPGSGPSEKVMQEGRVVVEMYARSTSGKQEVLCMQLNGDPGNVATCKLLSETALFALKNIKDLEQRAGVLTPALAFGLPLSLHLKAAGVELGFRSESP